jgi:hypothetical protein
MLRQHGLRAEDRLLPWQMLRAGPNVRGQEVFFVEPTGLAPRQLARMKGKKVQSLFDDVARILAKPAPRRQALKLAVGVLAGGFLGALGVKRAFGQDSQSAPCPSGHTACGTGGLCCKTATKKCCITATRGPFCAIKDHTCCANTACGPRVICCHGKCCAPGQTCVDKRCSSSAPPA